MNMFVGGGSSSPSTLMLLNNFTFPMDQLQISSGALNVGNNRLIFTGKTFIIGAAAEVLDAGIGSVKMQPSSGTSTIRSFQSGANRFTPELIIGSGTVTANTTSASLSLNGPLTVDAGATFSLNGFGVGTTGDVTINGTVNATGGPPRLRLQRNNFSNKGT